MYNVIVFGREGQFLCMRDMSREMMARIACSLADFAFCLPDGESGDWVSPNSGFTFNVMRR